MDRDALLQILTRGDAPCQQAAAALRDGAELYVGGVTERVSDLVRDYAREEGKPEFGGIKAVGDPALLRNCPYESVRSIDLTLLNPRFERWVVFLAPERDEVVACLGAVKT